MNLKPVRHGGWAASIAAIIVTGLLMLPLTASAGDTEADASTGTTDTETVVEAPKLATGTRWVYQSASDGKPVRMTLTGVKDGVATYRFGALSGGKGDSTGTLKESVATETDIDPARTGTKRRYLFPLHTGKSWTDKYTRIVKVKKGGLTWQYRYRAVISNEVLAPRRMTVGAGTYETWPVVASIHWIKDRPKLLDAPDGMLGPPNRATARVDGYAKEVLWYAPSVGRAVLRAFERQGWKRVLTRSPEDLLKSAAAFVTELVGYAPAGSKLEIGKTHHASLPSQRSLGFRLRSNNSWEFMMLRNWIVP